MKKSEIVERILRYHPMVENPDSCDGYKSGFENEECTGIVTALVPTAEVIEKAIALNANFLLVHEPVYYMTPDFPEWRGGFRNRVYEKKKKLIEDHKLTIWRDHDHMHAHKPDCIFTGVAKYLGWQDYLTDEMNEEMYYYPFAVPAISVAELQQYLIKKLNLNGLRYIGNPEGKISKVAIVAHLYPNAFGPDSLDEISSYWDYSTFLIRQMEEAGLQAIIPGEIIEWNVLSYIRDAARMGEAKACFNIGHFNMEELGMRYARDWLEEITEHQVSVYYVPTGDIFQY